MAVALTGRYAQLLAQYPTMPPPEKAKMLVVLTELWFSMTPSEQATVGPLPPPS